MTRRSVGVLVAAVLALLPIVPVTAAAVEPSRVHGSGVDRPRASPSAPTDVTASAGDERLTVSWRPPARGAAVTGYRVQRQRPNGSWVTVRDLGPGARRTVVRGLANGSTVRVRIAAQSAQGLGRFAGTGPIVLPLTLSISTGEDHTCAVLPDRTAVCFGTNRSGQLGDGTTTDRSTPVPVLTAAGRRLGRIRSIDAGPNHTCAVTTRNEAWCWGANDDGALGDGTITERRFAVAMRNQRGDVLRGVAGVTTADEHTCVWMLDRTARCMGDNFSGQLGRGVTSGDVPVPVTVLDGDGPLTGIVSMTTGSEHSCAVRANGSAVCFGDNGRGQLGDGLGDDHLVPERMVDGTTTELVATARTIDASTDHTCVLLADRTARCTGSNDTNEIGDGTVMDAVSLLAPLRQLPAGFDTPTGVVSIGAGDDHTCLIATRGRVLCVGANGFGQLGTGTTAPETFLTPVDLAPTVALSGAISLAVGDGHTCVRLGNGSVRCWGENAQGELGVGSTSPSELVPRRPIGL